MGDSPDFRRFETTINKVTYKAGCQDGNEFYYWLEISLGVGGYCRVIRESVGGKMRIFVSPGFLEDEQLKGVFFPEDTSFGVVMDRINNIVRDV